MYVTEFLSVNNFKKIVKTAAEILPVGADEYSQAVQRLTIIRPEYTVFETLNNIEVYTPLIEETVKDNTMQALEKAGVEEGDIITTADNAQHVASLMHTQFIRNVALFILIDMQKCFYMEDLTPLVNSELNVVLTNYFHVNTRWNVAEERRFLRDMSRVRAITTMQKEEHVIQQIIDVFINTQLTEEGAE